MAAAAAVATAAYVSQLEPSAELQMCVAAQLDLITAMLAAGQTWAAGNSVDAAVRQLVSE